MWRLVTAEIKAANKSAAAAAAYKHISVKIGSRNSKKKEAANKYAAAAYKHIIVKIGSRNSKKRRSSK